MSSFWPVTVTLRASLQSVAVKVSSIEPAGVPAPVCSLAAPASPLASVTVTSATGWLISATVKVPVPPSSPTVKALGDRVNPDVSSSSTVTANSSVTLS